MIDVNHELPPTPGPSRPSPHAIESDRVPTNFSPATRIGVLVIALALAAVLGFLYVRGRHDRAHAETALADEVRHDAEEATPVDVVHVHPSPAESSLSLPGEARSFYETTIFARTSGYVSKWFVDIGDKVKEGQVLATIETPELDDQVVAARAKVDQLKAEANVAQTSAKFAKVSYDRWEALAPQGAVSQQERDQKQAEMESAIAKSEAAKAQIALAVADAQRLNTLEGFKKVVAPFDGVITQRHVDIGALVTAGSTTNTSPMYTISQAQQVRVLVDVPQVSIPALKVGMPVAATAREYPGRTFSGKLDRTASSIDPTTKTLRVEVLVPNPELTLLPGMYLQVTFQSTRADPPVRIPAGAICFRPGGAQVAVVGADHTITFKDIKITRDLGDYVEIEGGISPNEEVALNVGSDVTTGDHIDPHDLDVAEAPKPGSGTTAPVLEAKVTGTTTTH